MSRAAMPGRDRKSDDSVTKAVADRNRRMKRMAGWEMRQRVVLKLALKVSLVVALSGLGAAVVPHTALAQEQPQFPTQDQVQAQDAPVSNTPAPLEPVSTIAPAITVNGSVITAFELRQRQKFLEVLSQQGDLAAIARDGLISERLETGAAKTLGVGINTNEVTQGMAEFAARGKLTTEQLVQTLGEAGVAPQTFRDFIAAGVAWRAAVRTKFGGRVTVSDAEIDRALATGTAAVPGTGRRLLLSEIVVPDDGKMDLGLVSGRITAKVKSAKDFAAMAQLYSKVGSASSGGSLGWMSESDLPPEVAGALRGVKPGEMTKPVRQQGALTFYFLRDVGQAGGSKSAMQVDYALYQAPVGTDLGRLQASLSGCDGLYVTARGLPAAALQRETVAEGAVPASLRGALASLDAGESTVVTGPAGTPALLMLCSRQPAQSLARDDIRAALVSQKIGLLAAAYLEDLRSSAIIVEN